MAYNLLSFGFGILKHICGNLNLSRSYVRILTAASVPSQLILFSVIRIIMYVQEINYYGKLKPTKLSNFFLGLQGVEENCGRDWPIR